MSVIGINIGLKSLLTSKAALEVIGHNLANANTPGFSRQSLDVSSSRSLLLNGLTFGNGVDADVVRRTTDALINKRLILQGSTLARLSERYQGLSDVEAFFGEPGEQGLSSLMSSFFDRVSGLSADPSDRVQRTGVLEAANDIAAQFNNLAHGLSSQTSDAYERVSAQVGQVNTLTARVSDLNKRITEHEAGGAPANDLRDQRDLALRELAGLVDVSFHESADGKVQVHSQGQLLVGPSRANTVTVARQPAGAVKLSVAGATRPWQPKGGSIGGLLALAGENLPGFMTDIDRLAKGFVFEMNKAHATGIPGSGPFRELSAAFAFEDTDGDGNLLDEKLGTGTLPFDVQDGEFYVNVTNETTGAMTRQRIEVDADKTTVGDLLDALDAIPGLSASLNPAGKLRITAALGLGFDFSRRMDAHPDAAGTFGGGQASLGSAGGAPFGLTDGGTLDLVGAGGPFTVTFDAADFDDIASATADEVAAALNADTGFQAGGMRAVVVGDRVALQSTSSGSAATFDVAGGSALGAFGWTAGSTVTGHDTAVSVEVGGAWTGPANQTLTFVPSGDGTIGTTPGLTVDVVDSNGNVVATLEVGQGYQPGAELQVSEGLTVRFGFGELSATDNDAFRIEALSDSDTSDLLGALGMNALFVGTDAATIALRPEVERDPTLLATSATGASGDNGVLLDLLRAADAGVAELGERTLSGFYGDIVGDVGFSVRSTANSMEVEQFVADSLERRREQVSGVNVDEQLVDMIRFEQAFAAAAQYIQVINQTQDELLSLL